LNCLVVLPSIACTGKGPVRGDAVKVLETEKLDIYQISNIDYSIGCLEWAVSVKTYKNKLCKSVLSDVKGKVSYLKGSATVSDENETVNGKQGLKELYCVVR